MCQSHDQEKAVRGVGQPAAGGGQRAGTFPQVHGNPPDQAALREVSQSAHTHTHGHTPGTALARLSSLLADGCLDLFTASPASSWKGWKNFLFPLQIFVLSFEVGCYTHHQ